MFQTFVIVCSLGTTSVMVTHPYQMHTVCEYFCKKEQSKYHYYFNPTTIIPYGFSCPDKKSVEMKKWVPR